MDDTLVTRQHPCINLLYRREKGIMGMETQLRSLRYEIEPQQFFKSLTILQV